tara:strand:+ start:5456 stop:6310 length:855 start_codon:yes stop_codon:yes gene_type:complete
MAIILPGGFQITNNEAVDSRLSVADQAARLGFSAANVYEGLLVYQQDTDEIYVLTDATDPTDNNNWNKIYPVASMTGSFSGSFTGSFDGLINSASFAETASYAEYAVSASHEIVHETSSSFAETASFAESGRGEFGGTFSGSNFSTEFTFDGDVLNVMGDVFVQGTLDAATKNFKIQHPTMPAYYLVHSSLEGPERGIYHRGKLKTSDTIYLPDYWLELTDDTDITVQLTPIGNSCQHFVKSVNREEIEVGCDCGKPHCFYIVHAQRYNEGPFNVLEPKKSVKL